MTFETDFTHQNTPHIVKVGGELNLPPRQSFLPPTYDAQSGDMICRSCGLALKRVVTQNGSEFSECGNKDCRNAGQNFFEGDYGHGLERLPRDGR